MVGKLLRSPLIESNDESILTSIRPLIQNCGMTSGVLDTGRCAGNKADAGRRKLRESVSMCVLPKRVIKIFVCADGNIGANYENVRHEGKGVQFC